MGAGATLQLPVHGDEQAVDAYVRQLLGDQDFAARLSAVEALGGVGSRGNKQILQVLVRCVESDTDAGVRLAAAKGIGSFAEPGDERCTAALARCLQQDPDLYVRRGAVAALGKVARRGDSCAIAALARRLEEDGCVSVRVRAAEVLCEVAERGNRQAVDALCRRLEAETDQKLACSLALSLSVVATPGDASAMKSLQRRLASASEAGGRAGGGATGPIAEAVRESLGSLRLEGDDGNDVRDVAENVAEITSAVTVSCVLAVPKPEPEGKATAPAVEKSPPPKSPMQEAQERENVLMSTFAAYGKDRGALRRHHLDRLLRLAFGTDERAIAALSPQMDKMVDKKTGEVDVERFVRWLCE
eukprot:TRINITY_DN30178_c0_g1_i1.p1 TRINITY_DN30178_c0_g1~~TRINITY_DN30178_c0_g1_i1.p1  ORF type:complete len:359 (-),score=91.22 TRINITY_DN30178_c0_g1_i1:46-1122(-)